MYVSLKVHFHAPIREYIGRSSLRLTVSIHVQPKWENAPLGTQFSEPMERTEEIMGSKAVETTITDAYLHSYRILENTQ